jgi:flavin prenyltransferase
MTQLPPIVVGLTGASGAAYGLRLLEVLIAAQRQVYFTASPSFAAVVKQELGWDLNLKQFHPQQWIAGIERWHAQLTATKDDQPSATSAGAATLEQLHANLLCLNYCHYQDLMTPIASGSFLTAGMVICPCSGATMAAVAHSQGSNLVHRAAEVHLKERRKLILVPRETPLSLPQIENMRAATLAGAVILPAAPGYYHGARTMLDLIDFVVSRICDQLGVDNCLIQRWGTNT